MNNHGEVVIRRATAADLAAIVALLADDEIGVGRESPDDLTPYQRAFEVIESDKHELLEVAERNGQVIGTLQLSLLPGLSRKGAFRAAALASADGSTSGQAPRPYPVEGRRAHVHLRCQTGTTSIRLSAPTKSLALRV